MTGRSLERPPGRGAALLVAHPGHELRLHAWVEIVRPRVYVLTDGSGHRGTGRLASTAAILARAGATPGAAFGRWTDAEAYRVILEGDLAALRALALEIADELVTADVELVASDAVEGFNPVHDLCRVLADAVASLAAKRLGHAVRRFDFLLEGSPGDLAGGGAGEAIRLELDDGALQRKLAAARSYPELSEEVERALAAHGTEAFGAELLRPADLATPLATLVGEHPDYERHGERRVAEGIYPRVLRARAHFLPLAAALRDALEPA